MSKIGGTAMGMVRQPVMTSSQGLRFSGRSGRFEIVSRPSHLALPGEAIQNEQSIEGTPASRVHDIILPVLGVKLNLRWRPPTTFVLLLFARSQSEKQSYVTSPGPACPARTISAFSEAAVGPRQNFH